MLTRGLSPSPTPCPPPYCSQVVVHIECKRNSFHVNTTNSEQQLHAVAYSYPVAMIVKYSSIGFSISCLTHIYKQLRLLAILGNKRNLALTFLFHCTCASLSGIFLPTPYRCCCLYPICRQSGKARFNNKLAWCCFFEFSLFQSVARNNTPIYHILVNIIQCWCSVTFAFGTCECNRLCKKSNSSQSGSGSCVKFLTKILNLIE